MRNFLKRQRNKIYNFYQSQQLKHYITQHQDQNPVFEPLIKYKSTKKNNNGIFKNQFYSQSVPQILLKLKNPETNKQKKPTKKSPNQTYLKVIHNC